MPAADKKLTPRMLAFVGEYLTCFCGTKAARAAGYAHPNQKSTWLLAQPHVQAELTRRMERHMKKQDISAERVLAELARVAFADIGEVFDEDGAMLPLSKMPEDARRAIAGIESDDLYEGFGEERSIIGKTRKVKLNDKLRALELLGKHLKLFTDKIEIDGALTMEQRLSKVAALMEKARAARDASDPNGAKRKAGKKST